MDARSKARLTAITVLVALLAAIMVVAGSVPRAVAGDGTSVVDGKTLVSDRNYSVAEVKAKAAAQTKDAKDAKASAAAATGSWYLLQSVTSAPDGVPLESLRLYYNGDQFMGYEYHMTRSYGTPASTTVQICSTYSAYGSCKPGYVRTDSGAFKYYAGPVYTPQYGGCEWLYGSMNWYGSLYQHVIQGHCG